MQIPIESLSNELLMALVEEFVSREGTDYGDGDYSFQDKVLQVRRLLNEGKACILFDEKTETCNIVMT
jgi:uncharacterized protein